jgi:hypothetical protein
LLTGPPALVFSLSTTVTDERIERVLPNASIWKMAAPMPGNDFGRVIMPKADLKMEIYDEKSRRLRALSLPALNVRIIARRLFDDGLGLVRNAPAVPLPGNREDRKKVEISPP